MPYITKIHVGQVRNVRDLEIDLALATTATERTASSAPPGLPGRHLILTGPNGSGKSGILEAAAEELTLQFFRDEEPANEALRTLQRSRDAARARLGSPSFLQDIAIRVANADSSKRMAEDYFSLEWSAPSSEVQAALATGEMIVLYLTPARHIPFSEVEGPRKLSLDPHVILPAQPLSDKLHQFLVNKHVELVFAKERGDEESHRLVEDWLAAFEQHVRWMTGDERLRMVFNSTGFNLYFQRGDGYLFNLNRLADGHAAVLSLMAEIILRTDAVQRARNDRTFTPEGVVIVDEIETHLHLKLQEQILPFLTALFPKLQLLVATHSPSVIASIPGAVVCDLGSREQAPSEVYRGVPYGALMTEHFGMRSDMDEDSTKRLHRLREIAQQPSLTPEQEQELTALAAELSARSAALATEVWMIRNQIEQGAGRHAGDLT